MFGLNVYDEVKRSHSPKVSLNGGDEFMWYHWDHLRTVVHVVRFVEIIEI